MMQYAPLQKMIFFTHILRTTAKGVRVFLLLCDGGLAGTLKRRFNDLKNVVAL